MAIDPRDNLGTLGRNYLMRVMHVKNTATTNCTCTSGVDRQSSFSPRLAVCSAHGFLFRASLRLQVEACSASFRTTQVSETPRVRQ
jgi:hypothetical protein